MTTNVEMTKIFEDQRQQYNRAQPMSLATRLTTLDQLERLLRENLNAFVEALQADFGQRDPLQIIGADLTGPLTTIAYTRKHLRKWMKPDKKRLGLMGLSGSREYVYNEPLGVVGIMSPFNAPIDLALDPAIEAIAA